MKLKACWSPKTNRLRVILLLSIIPGLLFSGCSKRYSDLPAYSPVSVFDSENESVGRFKTSYLADQIHAYFRGNTAAPIAVTTFVDINNLYNTSSFGRILGEQLISELVMKGYNVVELRRADSFQIQEGEGEFALSRELERLRQSQNLGAVVVGTYAVSPTRVYLNARVLDPSTSTVLSAGSVEMKKTEEISRLLRASSWPTSLERIPVRQLGSEIAPSYSPFAGGAVDDETTPQLPKKSSKSVKSHKKNLSSNSSQLPAMKLGPMS